MKGKREADLWVGGERYPVEVEYSEAEPVDAEINTEGAALNLRWKFEAKVAITQTPEQQRRLVQELDPGTLTSDPDPGLTATTAWIALQLFIPWRWRSREYCAAFERAFPRRGRLGVYGWQLLGELHRARQWSERRDMWRSQYGERGERARATSPSARRQLVAHALRPFPLWGTRPGQHIGANLIQVRRVEEAEQ